MNTIIEKNALSLLANTTFAHPKAQKIAQEIGQILQTQGLNTHTLPTLMHLARTLSRHQTHQVRKSQPVSKEQLDAKTKEERAIKRKAQAIEERRKELLGPVGLAQKKAKAAALKSPVRLVYIHKRTLKKTSAGS